MSRKKYYDDCCYEEMSNSTGGQSMPSECWDEPYCNDYEHTRKGYNMDGLDQSGMERHK